MLGNWLNRGMPIPTSFTRQEEIGLSSSNLDEEERKLEREFFIVRDRDVSWIDEDFWEAGYVLDGYGGPYWIEEETLGMALDAGKARGLVKSISDSTIEEEFWPNLQSLLARDDYANTSTQIRTFLSPICQLSTFHLRRILEEDCGLYEHLEAIEGLMYMRGFDVMEEWTEVLFERMGDSRYRTDSQGLISGLRDVIESRRDRWMNGPAIRLSYARRSEGLDGLRADYLVPFPLSQLFTPTSLGLRSQVFTFLLQLQHGRWMLSSLSKAAVSRVDTSKSHNRLLLKLRLRLVWLVNTLWTWITERVIELQIQEYRLKLARLTSLRAMISLELEHTRRVRNFCFLHESASDTYNAVTTILRIIEDLVDLAKSAAEVIGGSRTATPVTHVQGRSKQRMNRRVRRRSVSLDEEDAREDRTTSADQAYPAIGARSMEPLRLLADELQEQVTILRRGVEDMADAGGYGKANENTRETWNMLALALEDWR